MTRECATFSRVRILSAAFIRFSKRVAGTLVELPLRMAGGDCRLVFERATNWIDKYSQADECSTIGNSKISRLLFADDMILLSSTESGLQGASNTFADACDTAEMKICTAKTIVPVLHLSAKTVVLHLQ